MKIHTIEQINEYYFPKNVLNDLEETLCRTLNIPLFSKYFCEKNKKDPTTGIIQIDIPQNIFLYKTPKRKDIEETIKTFYSKRDYEVIQTKKDRRIFVRKGKINNSISVLQLDSLYMIEISKSCDYYLI